VAKTVEFRSRRVEGFGVSESRYQLAAQCAKFPITPADEPNNQLICRTVGTYQLLTVRVTVNTYTTATLTIRVRKNSANGNPVVSVAAATTGSFQDTTNSDTVGDGDTIGFHWAVAGGGSGTCTVNVGYAIFETSDPAKTTMRWATDNSNLTTATSRYVPVSAQGQWANTTEANAQSEARITGTAYRVYVRLSSNTRNGDSTFAFRLNGADSALTVSVPASTSGTFENTTDTVAIAIGDLINWRAAAGGTSGTLAIQHVVLEYETVTGACQIQTARAETINANVTTYLPAGGILIQDTESIVAFPMGVPGEISDLQITVSANTVSAASTLRNRKNGANGAVAVSIPASTTGRFLNTTDSDAYAAADEITLQLVTGATGTSLTAQTTAFQLRTEPPRQPPFAFSQAVPRAANW
jgi:hypothetical protein